MVFRGIASTTSIWGYLSLSALAHRSGVGPDGETVSPCCGSRRAPRRNPHLQLTLQGSSVKDLYAGQTRPQPFNTRVGNFCIAQIEVLQVGETRQMSEAFVCYLRAI